LHAILALTLVICGVAISSESFWIDECGVAYKAALPTLSAFWHKLSTEGSADLQQPFHHFFAWAWEKLVGTDEFRMRLGNAPFLLMGMLAVFYSRCAESRRIWFLGLILSSPFIWYYLNEARPYSVQLGASLLVFSSIWSLSKPDGRPASERRWVRALCFGMVLLAASGMLAMLWLGAFILASVLSTPADRLRALLARQWRAWVLTTAILLALGIFYLWTLSIGARATGIGKTDLRNLAFIPFELLGFSGLGPGRLEIRSAGLGAFLPWTPWIAVYGLVVGAVLVIGLRKLFLELPRGRRWCWPLAFFLVAAFILTVGVATQFRVLGRHCTPVLPILLFALATGAAVLWEHRRLAVRAVPVALLVCAIISALGLRFSARHAKDDYRAASRWAVDALERGEAVWWNADPEGAAIYGLPVSSEAVQGKAAAVVNPVDGFDTNLVPATKIVASKPDVYDLHGALGEYLRVHRFRPITNFTAFTVWSRAEQAER
jgi:hypothetical protein